MIAISIAISTTLNSSITHASNSDPVLVGECKTTELCSISNLRRSLKSSDGTKDNFLIKNQITNKVNHYTVELATSEFGQDRYIVLNKGAVNNEVSTAVSNYLLKGKNPNEGGLDKLGYVNVTFYKAIGPIFVNLNNPLSLGNVVQLVYQMTQAIGEDHYYTDVTGNLISSLTGAAITGTLSAGKFISAGVGTTLTFNVDGSTWFGVKEGPGIFVFQAIRLGTKITIMPSSVVLLDIDGNHVAELPFDGYSIDFSSLHGQSLSMSLATQTLWSNSFLSGHIELKNCNQLGCSVVIVDPKPD